MKIIKILSILFSTIVIGNTIIAFDIDSVNDVEKLEKLYDNLKQASNESNSGKAMREVIQYTKNLGIAVAYIDANGELGKKSKKIRHIIIKNSANIKSGVGLFGVSGLLPEKMLPSYKKIILRWFDGKE